MLVEGKGCQKSRGGLGNDPRRRSTSSSGRSSGRRGSWVEGRDGCQWVSGLLADSRHYRALLWSSEGTTRGGLLRLASGKECEDPVFLWAVEFQRFGVEKYETSEDGFRHRPHTG